MATPLNTTLPVVKCSTCGEDVYIIAMGDHICTAQTSASKSTRIVPPPIDPSIANRPFLGSLQPNQPNPDLLPVSPIDPAARLSFRSSSDSGAASSTAQLEHHGDSETSLDGGNYNDTQHNQQPVDDTLLPRTQDTRPIEKRRDSETSSSTNDNHSGRLERLGPTSDSTIQSTFPASSLSSRDDLTRPLKEDGAPPAGHAANHLHSGQGLLQSEPGTNNSKTRSNWGFAQADLDTESIPDDFNASDISRLKSRSGTSFPSIPSEPSILLRKSLDANQLGPVLEGQQLEAAIQSDSGQACERSVELEPPRLPASLLGPDSPTDPAIFHGNLSLVPGAPKVPEAPLHPPAPSAAATPPPKSRQGSRCRGCQEVIKGKSVSSADGRLTGRYHRACFVCYHCHAPFPTADFYILNDRPYCAQHYHELNGSLCTICQTGIEGQYLETVKGREHGITEGQKFHPDCLRCRACRVLLRGDYFEWNGQVLCERDAFHAARAPPPPGLPHRPALPSPLSQPHHYHRPLPVNHPGPRPGTHSSRPVGPRRYPERRTTRWMMI